MKVPDIVPVQPDASFVYIIKTHQQLYHGRLSGPCRPDDCNFLSRLYICAEIPDNRLILIVPKTDMLKLHLAAYLFQPDRMLRRLCFFFLAQKFKDTLCCRGHGLYLVNYLCYLLDRLRKLLDILDKCLDIANPDNAPDGKHAAGKRNPGITDISDKHHNRLHQAGQKLRFPRRFVQDIVGFQKLRNRFIFLIKCLYYKMPAVGFFHLSIDMAQIFLLRAEIFLGKFYDHGQQHRRYRKDDECNKRHQRRNGNHHRQRADKRRKRSNNLRHALI